MYKTSVKLVKLHKRYVPFSCIIMLAAKYSSFENLNSVLICYMPFLMCSSKLKLKSYCHHFQDLKMKAEKFVLSLIKWKRLERTNDNLVHVCLLFCWFSIIDT